jgi:putative restriction endonuclease
VEFKELTNPIKPRENMEQISPLLASKYAPLQKNGNGLQGIYLTEISSEFGELLTAITGTDLKLVAQELAPDFDSDSEYEINLEIEAQHLEGDLERIQVTKSRRGQGIFKSNVRLIESHCRITGITNIKHLRASHIKPWSASSNEEKLDGSNGLLLSPHVDHLFDRGFISFANTGDLLVSQKLSPDVLERWSISSISNVGEFRDSQKIYLSYHREKIFRL